MHKLIKDFGLTANQLQALYEDEHPILRRWQWREALLTRKANQGYWTWVEYSILEYQDELDGDNPYLAGAWT